MNGLADVYNIKEQAKAELLYSHTLEIRRRALGPEHPDTLSSMYGQATAYDGQGKSAQAEALYSQALAIRRRVLGPEHPETLRTMRSWQMST
jgi:non-specific serine/threonine protein kinase/serine/threonine-protein kinase